MILVCRHRHLKFVTNIRHRAPRTVTLLIQCFQSLDLRNKKEVEIHFKSFKSFIGFKFCYKINEFIKSKWYIHLLSHYFEYQSGWAFNMIILLYCWSVCYGFSDVLTNKARSRINFVTRTRPIKSFDVNSSFFFESSTFGYAFLFLLDN